MQRKNIDICKISQNNVHCIKKTFCLTFSTNSIKINIIEDISAICLDID